MSLRLAGLPEPSLNLSTVFVGRPLPEAIAAAAAEDVAAIEFWWPPVEEHDEVVAAVSASGIAVELFTLDSGEGAIGERGILADPWRGERLRANLDAALTLAERLGCRRLYTLIGNRLENVSAEAQLGLVEDRLRLVAEAAGARGIEVLIEPVNEADNGEQVIADVDRAAELLGRLGCENLGLLFDVFHVRSAGMDPAEALRRVAPQVRHVHLADFPGRVEPGRGEIDFEAIGATLRDLGYTGTIGLEYLVEGARS